MSNDETLARPTPLKGQEDLGAPRLEAPLPIPGYQFESRIGQGAMGVVYKGYDTGFNPPEPVAIKLMDIRWSANAEFRGRFEREAKITVGFRNDHIVRVRTTGDLNGTKYIVMEYLPGGTLADRIKQGLKAGDALRIMAMLAGALAESHSKNVVHRDFKPNNVLFTAEGKPVLTDFGIAKTMPRGTSPKEKGTRAGTEDYWAPEQADAQAVTDRADIYSLGVTLVEALTGQLPPVAKWVQKQPTDAGEIASLLPPMPPQVSDLTYRCLQVDPAARPSAAECHAVLWSAAIMVDRYIPEQPKGPTRSWLQRRWWVLALAIAAALVAVQVYQLVPRKQSDGALSDGAPREPTSINDASPPPSAQRVALAISTTPASAKVFVDGQEMTESTESLAPGRHQVLVVAPRHYGEVRQVQLPVGPQRIDFALTPTILPTADELDQFLKLDEATEISAADIASVTERTLQQALQAKLLLQGSRFSELDELSRNLDSLAKYDDARAAVASVLSQAMRKGKMSPDLVTPTLISASDNGDAMASFFVAIAYKEALTESWSSPEYLEYCRRMALAARQGWADVAGQFLKRDRCSG